MCTRRQMAIRLAEKNHDERLLQGLYASNMRKKLRIMSQGLSGLGLISNEHGNL